MESNQDHEVSLFYGNPACLDILLREELEEWARHPRVTVRHILSDGSLDDELYNGRITASKAMLLCDAVDTALPKKVLLSAPQNERNVLRGLDLAGSPRKTSATRTSTIHRIWTRPGSLNARCLPSMRASPFASPTTPTKSR